MVLTLGLNNIPIAVVTSNAGTIPFGDTDGSQFIADAGSPNSAI